MIFFLKEEEILYNKDVLLLKCLKLPKWYKTKGFYTKKTTSFHLFKINILKTNQFFIL